MIIAEDIYLKHFDDKTTTDQEVAIFLEHFGIKGMKWGIRNDRSPPSSNKKSTKSKVKPKKRKLTPRQKSEKRLRTYSKVLSGVSISLFSVSKITQLDRYLRTNPAAKHRAERAAKTAGRMVGKSMRAVYKATRDIKLIFEKDMVVFDRGKGPAPGTYANAEYIMKALTP